MLFSVDHIIPNLDARERFGAIREMVSHLVQVGIIRPGAEEAQVVDSAFRREKSMSTGTPGGFASPRARVPCVDDIVLVVGISTLGVEFDLEEGPLITFIAMFIIPANSQAHEGTMLELGMLFTRAFLRIQNHFVSPSAEETSKSRSAAEIYEIVKKASDSQIAADCLGSYQLFMEQGRDGADEAFVCYSLARRCCEVKNIEEAHSWMRKAIAVGGTWFHEQALNDPKLESIRRRFDS